MLNNMSISEFNFPNLGLGYYAIVIFYLALLLYKGRDNGTSKEALEVKEKYERILFTTLLSIFLFLLICIAITDIDLLKDAIFYKSKLPMFLLPIFNFIGAYRNLLVVLIVLGFLLYIILYLFNEFVILKKYKYSKKIFFGLLGLSILLEIYDFGSHYAPKYAEDNMNKIFTRNLNELVKNNKNFKYLILMDKATLPPYTTGTKKELLDFATYHNLKSNIGLYARNDKRDQMIYRTDFTDNYIYRYDIVDDAIYVFDAPCYQNAKKYDLYYYAINNYLFGVKNKFQSITIENKKVPVSDKNRFINISLKPIENIDEFIEENSNHSYKYTKINESRVGKGHKMVLRECLYCGYIENALDSSGNTGHIFTDYIYNNDAKVNQHGTSTAFCICGKKNTINSEDGILGHDYKRKIVQYPSNDKPGIQMFACSICNKTLPGTEKYTYVELEYESVIYDGNEHKPNLIIKNQMGTIVDKSQYTLEYKNNIQIGEAEIVVTFDEKLKEDYFPFSVYFTINPLPPTLESAKHSNTNLNIKWNRPDAKFDAYEVEVSSSNLFEEENTTTYDRIGKGKTDFTLKDIDLNMKYVRMRSFKDTSEGKAYSDWSNIIKFD